MASDPESSPKLRIRVWIPGSRNRTRSARLVTRPGMTGIYHDGIAIAAVRDLSARHRRA
jgi:hypothetical protein